MKKEWIQKISIFLLSAFIIVYFIVQAISSYSDQIVYKSAVLTSYEEADSLTAYILRNEKLVTTNITGTVYTPIEEGTRVKKGQLLATVYANAGEKNIQQRILEIEEKIELLEDSQLDTNFITSDITKLDSSIYDILFNTRQSVENNDLDLVAKNKTDLLINMNKRQIKTKIVKDFKKQIDQLKQERSALEATLSGELGKIYANASGYFSLDVDGWESVFTMDALDAMDVNGFYDLLASNPQPSSQAVGKICTDYKWYLLCPIEKKAAVNYLLGNTYTVDFTTTSNELFSMTLEKMINQTDSDTVILVFSTNQISDNFVYTRKQSVNVIRSSIEGLRINKESLRMLDGQYGVYILHGNTVRFRRVEILYTSDDYYLAKQYKSTDPAYESSLRLYDNVIVSGKNIYDGKIIG